MGTVKEEIAELKEDLTEAKKIHVGKKVFEAFKKEFVEFGLDSDVKAEMDALKESAKELEGAKTRVDELERTITMELLLSNLTGKKREIMKNILENVETSKLDERFNEVVESVIADKKDSKEKKEIIKESVTGGNQTGMSEEEKNKIRRLSGQIQ